MRKLLSYFRDALPRFIHLDRRLDEVKINQGRILCELNRSKHSVLLSDYEFKVFSQWGEDGIIQFLTQSLAISNRTFIEFGVEDFFESNCRFLLMKDLWSGFVIDGSPDNIGRLRSAYFYWRHPLQATASFITRENVGDLLDEAGFAKDVGILSIDVDGVDYHLLEMLDQWRASIVIVEYNSLFGSSRRVTVPYDASFQRNKAHWSNLYWGASLPAFSSLLNDRGYALVGVNSVGSNAFFVRRELLNQRVQETSIAKCFRISTFREGRTEDGQLSLQSATKSGSVIGGLPLLDLESGLTINVSDILLVA